MGEALRDKRQHFELASGEPGGFTSDRDGTQDIWRISARGGGARNLTPHPADDRNAVWSPDGRLVAFASNRDGDFEIFSMRANGKQVVQLTRNSNTDSIPDWQRLPRGVSGHAPDRARGRSARR